jgi:hypothetical protein
MAGDLALVHPAHFALKLLLLPILLLGYFVLAEFRCVRRNSEMINHADGFLQRRMLGLEIVCIKGRMKRLMTVSAEYAQVGNRAVCELPIIDVVNLNSFDAFASCILANFADVPKLFLPQKLPVFGLAVGVVSLFAFGHKTKSPPPMKVRVGKGKARFKDGEKDFVFRIFQGRESQSQKFITPKIAVKLFLAIFEGVREGGIAPL